MSVQSLMFFKKVKFRGHIACLVDFYNEHAAARTEIRSIAQVKVQK